MTIGEAGVLQQLRHADRIDEPGQSFSWAATSNSQRLSAVR
jgi:hypothetical protein